MKTFLLYLVFSILYLSSKSQDIKDYDLCKYKIAFNHLLCDSISWESSIVQLNNTYVSDSIASINIAFFSKELKKENETDREAFIRVSKLDEETIHKPIYSTSLSNIFQNRIDSPTFIVFFSKVVDQILLCEVLPLNKYKTFSYNQNTYFNESYIFMFIFQDNDIIKKVSKVKVAYN